MMAVNGPGSPRGLVGAHGMWRFRLEVCASQTQRQGDVWEEDTASFPLKNPFPAPALHPPSSRPHLHPCSRTSSHTWALRFVVYMAFHLYYDHLLMIHSLLPTFILCMQVVTWNHRGLRPVSHLGATKTCETQPLPPGF